MTEPIIDEAPQDVIKEEVATARKAFNLRDKLTKRNLPTATVNVYTDEVAAKQAQQVEGALQHLAEQIPLIDDAEAKARLQEKYDTLEASADEIRAALRESSLTFNLRGVPTVITKDARRKARKALGIEAKGIPDDLTEEYNDEYTSQLLAVATTSYVDNATGETAPPLTPADASALRDFLPFNEWMKLNNALIDIQFTSAVGDSATAQADF